MRLQGHQPGSGVATHCHAPRLGRAALSPRAAWLGGVCQGHTGTVDGWPWTAPGYETGSPSWTLVRLVVAACGFWSPKVMSDKRCWSPLVEFHQWTSSMYIHIIHASRFCKKNNFWSDNLIYYCNFSYRFAFGIMAFGVASSSVKSLSPANMCVSLRSAKLSARSVPPSLQELHGPEHAETRASRRNLERFQRQHGQLVKGRVRPKFPSKTFTGDMLESVSIFTKMFGLFWWKAGLWPCLFPTVKDFASEAASGSTFEFLKVLQFRFCSEHVWPIKRRLGFFPTCCSLGLGMDSHASFSQKYSKMFQQIALVCLWDLWLIHFRKFCIFHQASIDSQAYQHLPARDPASHWAASYHHLSIPFHWDHLSIEPEIGASNYQTVQTGRVSIWPPQYSKSAALASGIGSLPESIIRSGPLIVLPSNSWRKNNDLLL